jgi:hypothetical protein
MGRSWCVLTGNLPGGCLVPAYTLFVADAREGCGRRRSSSALATDNSLLDRRFERDDAHFLALAQDPPSLNSANGPHFQVPRPRSKCFNPYLDGHLAIESRTLGRLVST